MILALNYPIDDLLSCTQLAALEKLGGRLLSLGSEGCDVKTLDAGYSEWLTAIGAHYAIIRPDFYVAATASTPYDLAICFDTILGRMGVF